jgi:16S rRNA (guanine966-N2)-methyltransferase
MSRVIAGVAGGRRLVMPAGDLTRPTTDRAREGLFSTLVSLRGTLAGAAFLDLYAGSGAVGLEAASRGAARVVLVERDPKALRAVRANLESLALAGVEIRGESVQRLLAAPPDTAYDVVFVDPPYSEPVEAVVGLLVTGGWLAAGATVAVERASRGQPPRWPPGLEPVRSRRYGEATLWYGRRP